MELSRRLGFAILTLFAAPLWAQPLVFLSTQLNPVGEAYKFRNTVLSDFPLAVDFRPYDSRLLFYRLTNGATNAALSPSLVGGVHGDLTRLAASGRLRPLDDVLRRLNPDAFVDHYIEFGKAESDVQYYIPWMRAGYVMAAHRRALEYLPSGADLNQLDYSQLLEWAANIKRATGEARLGFPIGGQGLMHRFLQGFAYPSFTGGMIRGFDSEQARDMWRYLKELWPYVNPRSLTFDNMSEPLLSGEAWIAWGHTARLLPAFQAQPDQFVAFPAPVGPAGRGHLLVLAGLAIPNDARMPEQAAALIEYLTRPSTQMATLQQLGFFPVLSVDSLQSALTPGVASINAALIQQERAPEGITQFVPVGMADRAGDFDLVYLLSFSQIVLRNQDIARTLAHQADTLARLIRETDAACWWEEARALGAKCARETH